MTDQVYGPDAFDPLMLAAFAGPGVLETYTWDAANRLTSHINPAGGQTEYRYDGDNNRIYMGVTVGTGNQQNRYPSGHPAGSIDGWEPQYKKQQSEIYFTYDITSPLPEPLYATDASGTKWVQSYVYGAGGERLSMSYLPSADSSTDWEPTPGASGAAPNTLPETLYYLNDMLGSPLALLNQDSEVALRYHYDEFGTPEQPEKFDLNYPGPDNLFGYTGLGYDSASGLSYARARYFDSGIGRFVSQDTYEGEINNPQSLNLYAYVGNNPLIYVDPSGHRHEWGAGGGGSGGEDLSFWEKEWNALRTAHSSWYNAVDFWSMGTLTQINEYYRISQENPWSLEHWFSAGLIVINFVPGGNGTQKGVASLTDEGAAFIKSAIKGCNCFVAGTKVLTDEGEKPIEEIEVGDKVLAKDELNPNGELAYKEVTALYRNQRDDIIKLHVGEQIIETTDNHPFWGKGWVFADELQVGDKLQKANGSNLTIDKVEFVKLDKPVTVYNFTVADYHTYYVTDLGIWVHNTECGWTPHGYKHFANKNMSWKDVVKSTKSGPAKYLHGTDVEALERSVWENGLDVTNGKTWKVMKFDKVIGASEGVETRYVRVEYSGGTIHGHPITEAEYKKLLK